MEKKMQDMASSTLMMNKVIATTQEIISDLKWDLLIISLITLDLPSYDTLHRQIILYGQARPAADDWWNFPSRMLSKGLLWIFLYQLEYLHTSVGAMQTTGNLLLLQIYNLFLLLFRLPSIVPWSGKQQTSKQIDKKFKFLISISTDTNFCSLYVAARR